MKIEGNQFTIKFEVETPDEVPILQRFGTVFGPYCGSWINATVKEGFMDIPDIPVEDLLKNIASGSRFPLKSCLKL